MTQIESRINKKGVYLSLFFIIFIMGGMGILNLAFLIYMLVYNFKMSSFIFMSFTSFFIFYICFVLSKAYLQNSVKIKLDNEKIIIRGKVYYWKDMSEIKLLDKNGFGIFNYPMDGIRLISYKDKSTLFLFDAMYINAWEIKSFIKQVVIEKGEYVKVAEHNTIQNVNLDIEFDIFKGNVFFSFLSFFMWFLLVMTIFFMLLIARDPITVSCIVVFFLIMMAALASKINYIKVSNDFFIVKNHFFWWINKVYRISDIMKIEINTNDKYKNIRVVTNSYKSNFFLISNFSNDKCIELENCLTQRNVNVKYEIPII